MTWKEHVSHVGGRGMDGNAYSFSVGVSEGNTSFGRTRSRINDDINIYLEKQDGRLWTSDLTQGRNK
jgi:hypothetical protein